jgi:putative DNA primase/helicase
MPPKASSNHTQTPGQNVTPSHKQLAKAFLEDVNSDGPALIATSGEKLMTYDDGIWRQLTDAESVKINDQLSDLVQHELGGAAPYGTFSSVSKYLHQIRDHYRSEVEFNATPDLFGFRNGVLEIGTGKLRKHSPDHWITRARDYDYDPRADAPRFHQFMREVLLTGEEGETDEELIALVQEMFGYCLCSHLRASRVFYLMGEGANGKSVLLGVLAKMIGRDNVAEGFDVGKLNDETNAALLHGKLVAIQSEMDADTVLPDGKLKAMASGEPLVAKLLYENKFTFSPYATLILTGNNLPKTRDKSMGFWRRTVVIPFHACFVDEGSAQSGEKTADPNLDRRLTKELPGIFNWAYEGLQRLQDNQWRFTEPKSSLAATECFRLETDSVLSWAKQCLAPREGDGRNRWSSSDLYERYCDYCRLMGFRALSGQQFFKRFRRIVAGKELQIEIRPSRMSAGAGYEGRFGVSNKPVAEFADEADGALLQFGDSVMEHLQKEMERW